MATGSAPGRQERFCGLALQEREGARFLKSGAAQNSSKAPIAGDGRRHRPRHRVERGKRRRNPVEAPVTADVLDEIGFARHVHAKRGDRDLPSVPTPTFARRASVGETENPSLVRMRLTSWSGTVSPSRRLTCARASGTVRGCGRPRIHVGHAAARRAGLNLLEQLQRPTQGPHRRRGVGAAFESRRRFRLQPELPAGRAHGCGQKPRAFQRNLVGRRGDLG